MRPLLYLTACLFLFACSKEVTTEPKPPRPIMWTKVSNAKFEQVRTLSGIVAPVEATRLSFEVNGKVESVAVKLGDSISQGQVLASLNQRTFNLSLQSANAQFEQAKVKLADTEREYLRYQKLIKQGLISQSGFDNAKAAFDTSKSALDVAQAQKEIAQKNLQDSQILAPYDAIITKRQVEPSQQVAAGQSVFEIEGKHGLEVQVMVPETLIKDLSNGNVLPVTFPVLPGITIDGRITEIGTRAETASAFPVTVQLEGDNDGLRAGMTAELAFSFDGVGRTGHTGPSIKVPLTALSAGLEQKVYVFVFDETSQTVNRREVQTENILNNEVFISSGLSEGEIIATAGVAFLQDKQQVSLMDKTTQRFN